jgi:hypothetical protein
LCEARQIPSPGGGYQHAISFPKYAKINILLRNPQAYFRKKIAPKGNFLLCRLKVDCYGAITEQLVREARAIMVYSVGLHDIASCFHVRCGNDPEVPRKKDVIVSVPGWLNEGSLRFRDFDQGHLGVKFPSPSQ